MSKEKVIYTRWIMRELRKQGFPIVRVEKNPNNPNLDCYVFAATDEMIKAFTDITNKQYQ